MRRLPPLNALRAFETVARHGTIAAAAEELLVTPTAAGRHIKHLEDILGVALFDREAGRLTLTIHGREYARALSRGFELMADATDRVVDTPGRVQLTLHAYTTFLIRWLVPHLPEFQSKHPDVELRLITGNAAIDFARDENVDLDIRYGRGKWPGLSTTRLFEDELVAFGNSAMRDQIAAMSPEDAFGSTTLLVHALRMDDWPEWLETAGLSDVIPANQIVFDDLALIYQAALDGLGIGLSQQRYLTKDVADGRLHQLSPTVLRRQRGYHLVCRTEAMRNPAIRAFTSWIVDLVRSTGSTEIMSAPS
jgi:LysR family transcriptional regulator, glycine cleavage system transcriptional activator